MYQRALKSTKTTQDLSNGLGICFRHVNFYYIHMCPQHLRAKKQGMVAGTSVAEDGSLLGPVSQAAALEMSSQWTLHRRGTGSDIFL